MTADCIGVARTGEIENGGEDEQHGTEHAHEQIEHFRQDLLAKKRFAWRWLEEIGAYAPETSCASAATWSGTADHHCVASRARLGRTPAIRGRECHTAIDPVRDRAHWETDVCGG